MAIETGPRREVGRDIKRSRTTVEPQKSDHTDGVRALNELDTRADTICCGVNWRMLEPTGQCCDVRGFHESFDAVKDIPVASAATAITDENGVTYILVVNEALYFGSTLDHSLINPNQIRHFGIPVSDDPYDPNRELGIDHEELFIPFLTKGSTIYFESRVPTTHELEHCTYIVLTDDAIEWDPNNIEMSSNRPYGDRHATINQVKLENQRRREVQVEHESDLCLGSISRSLVPDLLYERLISSVNIEYKTERTAKMSTAKNKKLRHRADISKAKSKRPVRSRRLMEVRANARHSKITPEHVAKLMNIGMDKAKQMLRVTTQKGIRTAVHPITRRYRVDHLNLHSFRLAGQWYVDWLSAGTKSLSQNVGAFVYSNGTFTEVYPTASNQQIPANMTLNDFCNDVGVPHKLKSDRAPEFCGRSTAFLANAKKRGIDLTYAEPERKNQISPIDVEIREIRKRTHNKMKAKNVPRRLWDYCLAHQTKLRQFLPRDKLQGRSAYEQVTGRTPDISEYLDFDFYDLVWYHPGIHPNFGKPIRELGRWLGVSHRVGSDMCYWILTINGDIISESTVQHVTRDDTLNSEIAQQIETFDEGLTERLDDTNFRLTNDAGGFTLEDEYDLPQWDSAYGNHTPSDSEYGMSPDEVPLKDIDDIEPETYDKYIGAKIILNDTENNGGNIATITRRVTDDYGRPLGQAHSNPMFDTREFEVELENGESERIMANQIAMNLYSQLDDEGREILSFKSIVDHRSNNTALTKENGYVKLSNGHHKPKQTTRGWQLLVEFRDDTTEWIDLKDVKEANPVDLAEYAVNNNIQDEPAFAWWVPYVFKKRDRIIAKAKTKYWRTTHKYGVRLPKNAEEALRIDMETGTDFWTKAINKEMGKAKVSYEEVAGCTPEQARHGQVQELIGFQEIKCHLVFDVKMDFTRKARFVAGGHMTDTPVGLCYSSVVSRDSVRIAFTVAALNDLDIMACDIGNAYLNAPCREKIWFEAGIECGQSMKGKVMKLVRALYGESGRISQKFESIIFPHQA